LARALPASALYGNAHVVAEGDLVILYGRFSGHGLPRNWIVADVVCLENGLLAEHWDVIQNEVTQAESKSGLPMFGTRFAAQDTK
jgi:predicted SnoaL-like aldol condensation-catalyzing enzyme